MIPYGKRFMVEAAIEIFPVGKLGRVNDKLPRKGKCKQEESPKGDL